MDDVPEVVIYSGGVAAFVFYRKVYGMNVAAVFPALWASCAKTLFIFLAITEKRVVGFASLLQENCPTAGAYLAPLIFNCNLSKRNSTSKKYGTDEIYSLYSDLNFCALTKAHTTNLHQRGTEIPTKAGDISN
jgi:hypothetical protein